ncbi:MAG: hypothetical protein OHK0017_03570 [Patescibacteria group bacterium]
MAKNTPKNASTLTFVEVSEVREDVIVLREGQMRAVLAISSANFALKSQQEQDLIINTFQGLLNSLDAPLQILVQSRKLDLGHYIESLKEMEVSQQNDLLRVQMMEYIEYLEQMVDAVNIMSKNFFVIVGYEPLSLKEGLFGNFFRALNPTRVIRQKQEEFVKNRSVLMQRVEQTASKFASLGLKVSMLNTEQLIVLLYNSYNPDVAESIRLRDVASIDIAI